LLRDGLPCYSRRQIGGSCLIGRPLGFKGRLNGAARQRGEVGAPRAGDYDEINGLGIHIPLIAAMDVILKVLDGAKKGAKVAVKKNEFLIGRSQDCHLCVGSNAVSRKHCRLTRGDNKVAVEDLGSRNGTLVNGKKIGEQVELKSGDELTVGPLKFLVTISTGIKNEKKPQVNSVAEAAERAADASLSDIAEDDISRWLLGSGKTSLSETKTLVMDETNAASIAKAAKENGAANANEADKAETSELEANADEQTGDKRKGSPGKLPQRPKDSESKDSREAAVEALRAFNRRR